MTPRKPPQRFVPHAPKLDSAANAATLLSGHEGTVAE
jgi:hypothetical protein